MPLRAIRLARVQTRTNCENLREEKCKSQHTKSDLRKVIIRCPDLTHQCFNGRHLLSKIIYELFQSNSRTYIIISYLGASMNENLWCHFLPRSNFIDSIMAPVEWECWSEFDTVEWREVFGIWQNRVSRDIKNNFYASLIRTKSEL